MRLAFLTNLYPPYVVGGNEMLCEEVVNALRERGHEVSVVCGRGGKLPGRSVHGVLEIDLDRMEESFLHGRPASHWERYTRHLFSPLSYRATRRALRELDPDLVVVWNLYLASLSPLVAARRSRRPVLTHVADRWLVGSAREAVAPPAGGPAWKDALFILARGLTQPLLRRAGRPRPIVAISEFIKAVHVGAGFAAQDIEVIRLGVPTSLFSTAERAPRRPGEPLRLLYVGSLWEGKGPQVALRALGRLRREGVVARLDLCGAGVEGFLARLRSIAAEEGLGPLVSWNGFVPRERLPSLYREHHVLVFPSVWDEPFAAVPVEAMSCGMAVVATTAGGTPEAVEDGRSGLLVPPGDAEALAAAVRRLDRDEGLRLGLGREAARRARERFDFDDYVARLEHAYAAAAASGV